MLKEYGSNESANIRPYDISMVNIKKCLDASRSAAMAELNMHD